jgi:hypothetical protein
VTEWPLALPDAGPELGRCVKPWSRPPATTNPLHGKPVALRCVTAIMGAVIGLTFLFWFGNVLALGLRLGVGVPAYVAPLVAPAVDLSVLRPRLLIRALSSGVELIGAELPAVRRAGPAGLGKDVVTRWCVRNRPAARTVSLDPVNPRAAKGSETGPADSFPQAITASAMCNRSSPSDPEKTCYGQAG